MRSRRLVCLALFLIFAGFGCSTKESTPEKVRIKSSKERGEALGRTLLHLAPNGKVAERLIAEGADIVVTATTSDQILVRQEWISRGTFVASIGSYPELDPRLILNSEKVVVDSWAQSKHRGELSRLVREGLISEENIHGEIGEIVAGKKPGREKEEEIIVTCAVGYRGNIAASFLQGKGFQHVHSLAGGMKAWMNAGYPVES